MYKNIKIINEPDTFMKINDNKILKVQLIRPAIQSSNIENSIKKIIQMLLVIVNQKHFYL